jgi:hypothetical protein
MHGDPLPPRRTRHHLLDGGFTLLLLTLAIVIGYGVLSPSMSRARSGAPIVSSAMIVPAAASATAPVPSPADLRLREMVESADARAAAARLTPPVPEPVLPRSETQPSAPEPRVVQPEPVPEVLWSAPTVTGRVLDHERRPLVGASIAVRGIEVRTDAAGAFKVEQVPPAASLTIKMPGFAKVRLGPTKDPVEVALRPQAIKAAYLTYYGIGDRGIRNRVLDLTARTELNAVVIDVKGDRGWILYKTQVEQAVAAGAQGPATLRDFDGLMADLKARGIYTIARIVAFKDNVLATARPDLAVIDTRTGRPWIDNEKLAWVDPFREEVWAYNIAIAQEAIRRGFDEVQFDYVRFPTDGKLAAAKYARPNSKATRLPAIAAFLERARRELGASGAFVAADLFGYTAFNENDTDIGQRIEELAPHLDYISPMVYPSGYHKGIPGHRNPVLVPGKVVHESVRLIRKRSAGTVAQVRPWLQDFRDYAFDRRIFGVSEVQAQIRGSEEAGGSGWMLWNPRNAYTGGALRTKDALAAR